MSFDQVFPSRRSAPAAPAGTGNVLKGTVKGVRFTSPETGWSVLTIDVDGDEPYVAVGSLAHPHPGDILTLHGEWIVDGKWGNQFRFTSYSPEVPTSAAQAEAYLGSGRIPGIGKSTAKDIVAHFGDATMDILENNIDKLINVYGIGEKKLKKIKKGWEETTQQRTVALVLAGIGVSTGLAGPLWDEFGSRAADLITDNPYLLTKAKGVGFATCDQIAGKLGWPTHDVRRLSAGIEHVLTESRTNGHCYLPVNDLLYAAAELLAVDENLVSEAIQTALDEERLILEDQKAYTTHMHKLECDLAEQVKRIAQANIKQPKPGQKKKIEDLLADRGLTDEQEKAVRAALQHPLTILTGGPGVGKSHTIATITQAAAICGWQVALCAPTGRAAQRMGELDGGTAGQTVHRLVGIGAEGAGATHNPDNPLDADLVICDESSMLDVSLARYLLRAINTGCRLLLVGDTDQLPSVGPGSVLRDLIASDKAVTTALTQIFRQAAASGIVQVAHAVNRGEYPVMTGWDDLHFWSSADGDTVAERTIDMVCRRIPDTFGIPVGDIQVLTPQRRGSCGTVALNTRLQEILNPDQNRQFETKRDGVTLAFRPGDRAMVIRNNYDKLIFNGTPVVVDNVDPDGGDEAVTVRDSEGRLITYASKEVKDLALAYAVTIHKSQGSQYPCVVIPFSSQAYMMLVRNLLYTGITRAQTRVVIIGEHNAIRKAVTTVDSLKRYTHLAARIKN